MEPCIFPLSDVLAIGRSDCRIGYSFDHYNGLFCTHSNLCCSLFDSLFALAFICNLFEYWGCSSQSLNKIKFHCFFESKIPLHASHVKGDFSYLFFRRSIPWRILFRLSSFPRIAQISIPPPGVNCFPETATRIGHNM